MKPYFILIALLSTCSVHQALATNTKAKVTLDDQTSMKGKGYLHIISNSRKGGPSYTLQSGSSKTISPGSYSLEYMDKGYPKCEPSTPNSFEGNNSYTIKILKVDNSPGCLEVVPD